MKIINKLLFLLSPREQKHAFFLLLMMLIMALIDLAGVASILPFMTVLTNPEIIENNILLNKMFKASYLIGVESRQDFIFFFGILVLILLVTSLIIKALTTFFQARFVQLREYSISKRLVEGYLHQPYTWFLNQNSANLGKNILSEVGQIISNGISPLIELISKSIVAISLVVLLILVDPKLALIVSIFLGGFYMLIFYFIKGYLEKIGNIRLENNRLRFSVVSEAFGSIKCLKLSGLEQILIEKFSHSALTFAKTSAASAVARQLPRFILEAIAFSGIIIFLLHLILQNKSFNNALPIISLYIFAGYRLLPALQQIYGSLTQITFVKPSLDKIVSDLNNLQKPYTIQKQKKLKLNKEIKLNNICYDYPNSSITTLKDINLTITAKNIVGIIGTTGAGKTTIVDVILGLLEAQKGTVEVDGQIITKKNLRSWQNIIGYVPQQIYLLDDTVQANIAFGIKPENIDQNSLIRASKIANLHDFVTNELVNKYHTKVGEQGVRISGGQRQRIGIARALYHDPQVLVLDEATSALDNETEQAVVSAINNLRRDITIILIAHRLNTIKNCDIIFKIDKGKIIEKGSFYELFK
jgi:ABC-type multidrug transport system fused ATPase/permease subunit